MSEAGTQTEAFAKRLDGLVTGIEELNRKLKGNEPLENGAARAASHTLFWRAVWGFAVGNAAIIGIAGTFLYTTLSNQVDETAKNIAETTAATSTKAYLENGDEIRGLTEEVTTKLIEDARRSVNDYQRQEREIIRNLASSEAVQGILATRGEELQKHGDELQQRIQDASAKLEQTSKTIFARIDEGVATLDKLQTDLGKDGLVAQATRLKSDVEKLKSEIVQTTQGARVEIKSAEGQLKDYISELNKTAAQLGEEMRQKIVADRDLLAQVVAGAAAEFSKPGGLDEVLIRKLEPQVLNAGNAFEPSQRAQALQLVAVFASEPLLRKYTSFVLTSESAESSDLFGIALRSYPPASTAAENQEPVQAVLEQLGRDAPSDDAAGESYRRFLRRLPGDQAGQIAKAISPDWPDGSREVAVTSLAEIGGSKGLAALTDLAKNDDESIRRLAFRALSKVDTRTIDDESREKAMLEVWSLIQHAIRSEEKAKTAEQEAAEFLSAMAKALSLRDRNAARDLLSSQRDTPTLKRMGRSVRAVLDEDNPEQMAELAKQYSEPRLFETVLKEGFGTVAGEDAFANLVESKDWGRLTEEPYWPADASNALTGTIIAETLLKSFAKRLESEHADVTPEVADGLVRFAMKLPRSLYRDGLSQVLTFSLAKASEEAVGEFLSDFVAAYESSAKLVANDNFRASDALAVAIERDAAGPAPYAMTHEILTRIDVSVGGDWKLVDAVLAVMPGHLADPQIRDFVSKIAVQQSAPGLAAWSASLTALKTLRGLEDETAMQAAAVSMLDRLEALATQSKGFGTLSEIDRKKAYEQTKALGNEIVETLSGFVSSSTNPDSAIQMIVQRLPRLDNAVFKISELESAEYLASAFYDKGKEQEKKDSAKAEGYYSAAISIENSPRYRRARGWVRLDSNNLQLAVDDAQAAVKLEESWDSYLLLGIAYVVSGNEAEAIRAVARGEELAGDPSERAGIRENLGILFIKRQEWKRTIDHTAEVSAIYAGHPWNWLIRAIAAHKLGQKDVETEAWNKWDELKGETDLADLKIYLGPEIDAFLADRS